MQYTTIQTKDFNDMIQLFITTFSASDGPSEGAMVGCIVRDLIDLTPPDDLYGFTARTENHLVGGLFFSRITYPHSIHAVLLSPMAVATAHQRRGIGQKLIQFGLDTLTKDGMELVLTYGDPAFYSRIGFRQISTEQIPAPYPLQHLEGWLAHPLNQHALPQITDTPTCAEALNNPAYW